MSKRVEVTSKKWAGSVTIADPLIFAQAKLIEDAIGEYAAGEVRKTADGRMFLTVDNVRQLPAIFACVEKWELANMPADLSIANFPASPRRASNELIAQLFGEIYKVYIGELEIPNE